MIRVTPHLDRIVPSVFSMLFPLVLWMSANCICDEAMVESEVHRPIVYLTRVRFPLLHTHYVLLLCRTKKHDVHRSTIIRLRFIYSEYHTSSSQPVEKQNKNPYVQTRTHTHTHTHTHPYTHAQRTSTCSSLERTHSHLRSIGVRSHFSD